MTLAIPLVAGYLVALPIFAWAMGDLRRFHRHEWSGYGRPTPWRTALIVSYALAGWPVIVVALTWRMSFTRRAMKEQRSDRHGSTNGL